MPFGESTTQTNDAPANSLEGLPAEIQHYIAHLAGPQGKNAMILLNRGFYHRLASFHIQQYQDEITRLLHWLNIEADTKALFTQTPATKLRHISSCLKNFYKIRQEIQNYSKIKSMVDLTHDWLKQNSTVFFARILANNSPIKFSTENPPVFGELIMALLLDNKSFVEAVIGFNDGKLCADMNKNKTEALFFAACMSGKHELIESVLEQYQLQNIGSRSINAESLLSYKNICDAFFAATRLGLLETTQKLWELCLEEQRQNMLATGGFQAFRYAASKGHLKTAQWLWEICPEKQRQNMLADNEFETFCEVTKDNPLETLQWFWKICPEGLQQNMLAAHNFGAFQSAAHNGHLKAAQWLWELCPKEQQQNMLAAHSFGAFRNAAADSHLEVLQWLWELCPDNQQQNMLSTLNFCPFYRAIASGHLKTAQWLWEICPESQQQNMLATDNCSAFGNATRRGHLEVAQWFWKQGSLENKQKITQLPAFESLPKEFKETLLTELAQLEEESSQLENIHTSMKLGV